MQIINETACPFCLNENQCKANNNCWCASLIIPNALTALVPTELKDKTCICNACVIRFNHDPGLFIQHLKHALKTGS
jgi:hypothetical protein